MRTLLTILMLALIAAPVSALKAQKQTPAPKKGKAMEEEVAKPTPFTELELRVIRSAPTLPLNKLVDLVRTYEKRENDPMAQILARQVLRRDPHQADALRVTGGILPKEEVRPANYVDMVVKDLRAGRKVDDPETVVTRARALTDESHGAEAVALLEKLQAVNFAGVPFPFNEELGFAYRSAGQMDKAEAALKAALKQAGKSESTKRDVEKELEAISLDKKIAGLRARAVNNPAEGLEQAKKLRNEMPNDPEVVSYLLEALHRAGRDPEAITMLEEMKRKTKDPVFAYQDSLAFAYMNVKNYAKARAAFNEISNNENYDLESREEARMALAKLALTEKLEGGRTALTKGELDAAGKLLRELEKQYPNDDEVVGFRATWMAKTGHADEALTMLLQNKQKAANAKRLFTQQGALADLYMERKEYNLAALAYEEIISNPAYGVESRTEAEEGAADARREKLLDQGYKAIKNSNLATARDISESLNSIAPNDPEVLTYMADLDLASGHPKEALAVFEAVKSRYYVGAPFPGQEGIADALSLLGHWEEAYGAYSEILTQSGYDPEDVFQATLERRALRPFFKNDLRLDVGFTKEEQGRAYRELFSYQTSWLNNWRGIFTVRQDNISLKDDRIINTRTRSSVEGQFALQRRFAGGYFVEGHIGGAESNVLYGARIGKISPQGLAWSLGFSGNERSTQYSLPLEVLNGRENRVDFKIAGPINNRLHYDFNAFANSVNVGGQRLGRGYGFSGSIGYTLQQETRMLPEITFSYVGEYSRFKAAGELPDKVQRELRGEDLQVRRALTADQELKAALPANFGNEIFDELAAREVNRHGVELTLRKHLSVNKTVFAHVGSYYDFIDRSVNFTLGAGAEWWLSENSMLYIEIRYDSNGRGSNSGGGVWEGNLGAQMTF